VKPTYHDLYITTPTIPRTRFSNLPSTLLVTCNRSAGWELWRPGPTGVPGMDKLLAGEFGPPELWLVLDVAGHVIVDSRGRGTLTGG